MRALVASAGLRRYGARMLLAAALAVVCPQTPPPAPSPPHLRSPVVVLSGANNHEWQWTSREIAAVLTETGVFDVTNEDDPGAYFARVAADGTRPVAIVLDYNGPRWSRAAEEHFVKMVRDDGVGVCVVHAANNAFAGWREYEQMVGLLWRDGSSHGAYHPFDVNVVDHHHPVTRGMADLRLHPDELYHGLVPAEGSDHRVLLSAFSDPQHGGTGRHEPMATAGTFGKGRVFHTPLGHTWQGVPASRATWADPQLRLLVARGVQWATGAAVSLSPVPLNRLSADEQKEGFVSLFDGRTIASWRAFKGAAAPAQGWVVADAAIVHEAGGGGGDLVSVDEYGDFDFRFSFRVASKANSGVMWHVTEDNDTTYMSGPEYQVLDDRESKPDAKHGVGALYDLVPPQNAPVRPAGAWNDGRIVVHGGRVKHWLNGVQVVDAPCAGPEWDAMVKASKFRDWPFNKAARGRLALQDHGDGVAYRNLRIRPLP